MATNIMKDFMPDAENYMVSLLSLLEGSKLELDLQQEMKSLSLCHSEMDVDQQLNFYYLDPVATMDRFIRQPKFASKACMKFESQESEQRLRIRQESKLPVSGSPAQRHAQCPIAALTLC